MQQTTREHVEARVRAEVDAHVPRLWRSRAVLYIPLIVDRIVAIVDELNGGPRDAD